MHLAAGTRLGPYKILAPIGAGGMGEVYRAEDTRLGRSVALKVLPPTFAQDTSRQARFEREARSAGALNHPNIVSIYDIGHQDEGLYIVSELVEGESLRVAIRKGPMAAGKVAVIGTQIAEGMAAAHDIGIVHRDLKPDNIMLTRDGRAKILDFGLAKWTGSAKAEGTHKETSTMTEPGTVMGSAGYMSPEQARGQPTDHRSDIFSFGAILYEMISGHRAFAGEVAAEAIYAILKVDPPELPATAGPVLESIVRRCIEKEPGRRFQTAADLAFALQSLSSAPRRTEGAPAAARRPVAL